LAGFEVSIIGRFSDVHRGVPIPRPVLWLKLYEAALSRPGKADSDQATVARIAALVADYAVIEYESRRATRFRYEKPAKDEDK
jgi:hypothetical protein